MGVALLAIEEAAQTKRAGEGPLDRFVEQQIAGLGGTEGLIGQGLLGQFAVDAHHVFGQRIDLAAVLELDVLLAIVLGRDSEAEGAAIIDRQLLGSLRGFEGNADDGNPALAILSHDQHRLVLIADCGGLQPIPEWHHGHTAGHRVIEQTADKSLGEGGLAGQ